VGGAAGGSLVNGPRVVTAGGTAGGSVELSVTVDTAGFGEIGEIGIYSCKNSKCQVSIHTASRISRVASFVGLGLWLGLGLVVLGLGL